MRFNMSKSLFFLLSIAISSLHGAAHTKTVGKAMISNPNKKKHMRRLIAEAQNPSANHHITVTVLGFTPDPIHIKMSQPPVFKAIKDHIQRKLGLPKSQMVLQLTRNLPDGTQILGVKDWQRCHLYQLTTGKHTIVCWKKKK